MAGGLWAALARRGFLASSWPWRSLAYLVSTVPVGMTALFGAVLLGAPVGELERRRLRLVGSTRLATAHRRPATWRERGYTVLLATVLWPLDMVLLAVLVPGAVVTTAAPLVLAVRPQEAYQIGPWTATEPYDAWPLVPAGLVVAVLTAYLLAVVAGAQGALARHLLAPGVREVLGARLAELGRSPGRLVDAFEAERRRIERDLHDGAQQRLVAVAMNLGEAQLHTPVNAPAALPLARAHEQAGAALSELRELIRNVHPKVLDDHGLAAALTDVAARCGVPVQMAVDLPGRLPRPVESAAYFAAAEALTNVDKHGRARRAGLACRLTGGTLVLRVTDDGVGGADPSAGTGLTGLADRLAVLAGTMTVSSPAGGPTVVHVEIPCVHTGH